MLLDHAFQRKAYEAVAAALPLALDGTIGIEDRSDGGGIMSLASKSLFDYVMAHRNA